jgi:hypothetical protein
MPRLNGMYPHLDSFGLEIETDNIMRGRLPSTLGSYFHEEHDASIESDAYVMRVGDYNVPIMGDRCNELDKLFPRTVVGSELVSNVMDINDPTSRKVIEKLMGWLLNNGECEESERCGIHVHICTPYNLTIMKNLMRIMRHSEQVFYYLGGMGYNFRGMANDFTYCRPITRFGPQCVDMGDHGAKCFDLDNLLNAPDILRFWDAYGGINPENPPNKYYPVRYNWFTLFPILTKNTVEFRVFNKTLNPNYVWSVINFCRSLVAYSVSSSSSMISELPENSIYESHNKDHVISTVVNIAKMVGSDKTTIDTLVNIVGLTPEVKIEPKYVYTHLRNIAGLPFRYTMNEHINKRSISKPKFVDLHVLRGEH